MDSTKGPQGGTRREFLYMTGSAVAGGWLGGHASRALATDGAAGASGQAATRIESKTRGVDAHREVSLKGEWLVSIDAGNEGARAGYFRPDYDAKAWKPVPVPAGFGTITGDPWFTGTIWYRRSFRVPRDFCIGRTVLRFEGVNNHAEVWLNGDSLAKSESPYLPWEVPVTGRLSNTGDNTLVVCVNNLPAKSEVPWPGGWHHDGGILRDVRLISTYPVYIDDVRVVARPAASTGQGECALEVRIACEGPPPASPATVRAEIFDAGGARVAAGASESTKIEAGEPVSVALRMAVPGAKPWSPDTPVLYRAELQLLVDKPVDSAAVRFGFREVAVDGVRLLLNGEPLYLMGFNRHEDTPKAGMASDDEQVRADLSRIKQAGGNFLRVHYPHDPYELDVCDELGLLVMAEAPIGSWDGVDQEHLVAANHYVRELIRRDKNHPCVAFWSVGNESNEEKRQVVKRNDDLIKLAKRLDPTRPVVHVSERSRWAEPKNHPLFEFDDVVCVNGYPSELGRIWAKNERYDFNEAAAYWRKVLAELHDRYQKPILITEFGYPSGAGLQPAFDGDHGEAMQAKAIAAEFEAFHEPYICGATVWCFADHLWPKGAYAADISPYGVLKRNREPKVAWPVVQRLFQSFHANRLQAQSGG